MSWQFLASKYFMTIGKIANSLGPLKPGQSVITFAFNLRAKYVVHTVCPRYMDGLRGEHDELDKACASALAFYLWVQGSIELAGDITAR